MGWRDAIAGYAGLKAIQSGADIRIGQAGLDVALIPKLLREHANAILKQRYLQSEIEDNDFDAGLLKLGIFYQNAESAGQMQLAAVIYDAIIRLREIADGRLSNSINLEVFAASGMGPMFHPHPADAEQDDGDHIEVPPIPEDHSLPAPEADLSDPFEADLWFEDQHLRLDSHYDDGDLNDDEYRAAKKKLILDECAAVIDRRLPDTDQV